MNMSDQHEAILIVAVYIFVAIVGTLPIIITYLFVRITNTINRANKILSYVEEAEVESRKYHE